jgi:hypothetical protein
MYPYRVGRITGALSLVALGSALLADNLMQTAYTDWVLRLWPLLLVGVGLEYLTAGLLAERRNTGRARLAWGTLIVVLVLGLTIGFVRGVNPDVLNLVRFGVHFGSGPIAWNERTQEVSATGIQNVKVQINVGSVELVPSQTGQIQIHARYSMSGDTQEEAERLARDASRFDLGVTTAGDTLTIDPQWRNSAKGTVKLSVAVPAGLNLQVDSGAGTINAARVEGKLHLESGVGEIRVEDAKGEVSVNTGAGAVSVVRFTGPVVVETATGQMTLEGVAGDVTATTSTGRIDIRDYRSGELKARANTGAVSVEYGTAPTAGADISSHVGKVEVRLPENSDVRVSGHSGTGSIKAPDWVEVQRQTTKVDATGTLGKGTHTITLRTDVGSIEIDSFQR